MDLTFIDGRVLVLLVGAAVVAFNLGAVYGYAKGHLDGRDEREWAAEEKRRLACDRSRALRLVDSGARIYDFERER